jgi:hypothetical protein
VVADENTVFHFPTISMYCSKLSYIYSIFIVYYSAGMLFFLTHFLKKVMCLFTYDLTILRKIDIGCIVVIEIQAHHLFLVCPNKHLSNGLVKDEYVNLILMYQEG